MLVLYSAAHGGYGAEDGPLGGGATIANQLMAEWSRTRPFDLRLLGPSLLGDDAPTARDLTSFSESSYAAFCHEFDAAVTTEILRHDPATTRVLINDISEAPVFRRLAERGFPLYTIYHVDVVAYVAKIYGRGMLPPKRMVQLYDKLGWILPSMAKLVFEKQKQSLEHSRLVIVPSSSMRDLLLECYPDTPPARIRVLPWGYSAEEFSEAQLDFEIRLLRDELQLHPDIPTLLTLSRLSPEKGHDLLLDAIAAWEETDHFPASGLNLVICGEPAYMKGQEFYASLLAKSQALTKTKVRFPGYVTGLRKAAMFRIADLYVFPSRHESYGLTLLEALAAGLPAVTLNHDGARTVMRPEFGDMVPVADLILAIERLLRDPVRRAECGRAAQAWAQTQPFSRTASTLAQWMLE